MPVYITSPETIALAQAFNNLWNEGGLKEAYLERRAQKNGQPRINYNPLLLHMIFGPNHMELKSADNTGRHNAMLEVIVTADHKEGQHLTLKVPMRCLEDAVDESIGERQRHRIFPACDKQDVNRCGGIFVCTYWEGSVESLLEMLENIKTELSKKAIVLVEQSSAPERRAKIPDGPA